MDNTLNITKFVKAINENLSKNFETLSVDTNLKYLMNYLEEYNLVVNDFIAKYLIETEPVVNKIMNLAFLNKEQVDESTKVMLSTTNIGKLFEVYEKNIRDNVSESKVESHLYDCSTVSLYLRDLKDVKILSKQKTRDLFLVLKNGNRQEKEVAKEKLILSNLRIAYVVARKYCIKYEMFDEYLSLANLGLIKAVENYDVDRGFEFSTYAYKIVPLYILRELQNTNNLIRVPIHITDNKARASQAISEYQNIHGSKPSAEQLAALLDVSLYVAKSLISDNHNVFSFDAKISDCETTFLDSIPDKNVSICNEVEERDLQNKIIQAIDSLNANDIDKQVLKHFYEIDGYERITQCELGKMYGTSHQRIQQRIISIMKKFNRDPDLINLYASINSFDLLDTEKKLVYDLFSEYYPEYIDQLINAMSDVSIKFIKNCNDGIIKESRIKKDDNYKKLKLQLEKIVLEDCYSFLRDNYKNEVNFEVVFSFIKFLDEKQINLKKASISYLFVVCPYFYKSFSTKRNVDKDLYEFNKNYILLNEQAVKKSISDYAIKKEVSQTKVDSLATKANKNKVSGKRKINEFMPTVYEQFKNYSTLEIDVTLEKLMKD